MRDRLSTFAHVSSPFIKKTSWRISSFWSANRNASAPSLASVTAHRFFHRHGGPGTGQSSSDSEPSMARRDFLVHNSSTVIPFDLPDRTAISAPVLSTCQLVLIRRQMVLMSYAAE